jgi:glycosyltransferase involved in cell wall biosynthesis
MTANLPKISIVTPSFNQANFIEQAIQSVLGQSYPNLEYLVMDGGSTDGTLDVLKKYEKYLCWVSRKDRGQSDALNKGFLQSSGEILAFLNSDDQYEPGAFLKVGEFFANNPEAKWVTGKCRIIDTYGREIRKLVTMYKNFWLKFKSPTTLFVIDYISQPATFWHRSVIDKVGLFDEDLNFSMDYDYSLRLSRYFNLFVINSYLAAFRLHPGSKSSKIREHFDCDMAIAHRYSRSELLSRLHRLHNVLIVSIYESLETNPPKRK